MGNISTTTDTLFAPLTVATAPEASRPMLEKVQKSLGFIPNLMAIFANNAAVLEGYLALGAVFEKGSFTPRERQIFLLAASVENNCNYCAAAHSQIAIAASFHLLKEDVIRASELSALLEVEKIWSRDEAQSTNSTRSRATAPR